VRGSMPEATVKVARDSFPEVGTLPRVPAQEQKKPYIAQARYYIEQRGQTDMRNILIDTVYVTHHKRLESTRPEHRLAARTWTAEQIKEKLRSVCNSRDGEASQELLSAREKEIIVGVVKGLTNKQIAERLFISAHTVITHRRNIAAKLQIHSPAGLTIYGIVNKLVELSEIKDTITDPQP